jgi:hypothetical protein
MPAYMKRTARKDACDPTHMQCHSHISESALSCPRKRQLTITNSSSFLDIQHPYPGTRHQGVPSTCQCTWTGPQPMACSQGHYMTRPAGVYVIGPQHALEPAGRSAKYDMPDRQDMANDMSSLADPDTSDPPTARPMNTNR